MRYKSINQTTVAGLLIAFGVLLPMIFHSLGLGSTFLPMHIPVLLSGFFLDTFWATAVGAMTPLLSSLITSMPPVFPVLPFMVFELATYGSMTSFLYRRTGKSIYISLVVSMIAGRIVAGFIVWMLTSLFAAKLPGPVAFITGSVVKGLPGIVIQLLLIPAIVFLIEKHVVSQKRGEDC